jgi:hypothetical protein
VLPRDACRHLADALYVVSDALIAANRAFLSQLSVHACDDRLWLEPIVGLGVPQF